MADTILDYMFLQQVDFLLNPPTILEILQSLAIYNRAFNSFKTTSAFEYFSKPFILKNSLYSNIWSFFIFFC